MQIAFVDTKHPLHDLFPPRVWRFGSRDSHAPGVGRCGIVPRIVMIRSSRKKAAKAKAAGKKKA